VQNLLRATFNNIEELGISFVKYSLIQWLKLWEQEVWRKLLTPAEQNDYYAKFVVDALERGNMASRTEASVKKFFNGHWTLEPMGRAGRREPHHRNDGDRRADGQSWRRAICAAAMIPLALAAKGPQPAAGQQPPADPETPAEDKTEPAEQPTGDNSGLSANSHRQQLRATQRQLAAAMLRDVMSRMVSLEVNAVKRVAEKPSRFDARLREFYDKHKLTMARSSRDRRSSLPRASRSAVLTQSFVGSSISPNH
jgi:hypothetical protein